MFIGDISKVCQVFSYDCLDFTYFFHLKIPIPLFLAFISFKENVVHLRGMHLETTMLINRNQTHGLKYPMLSLLREKQRANKEQNVK